MKLHWKLVEAHGKTEPYDVDGLVADLVVRGAEAIVAFNRWFSARMAESYREDLWGAAFVALGGCSDDGFDSFRAWLVSKGRRTFEAVLRNPDGLAKVIVDGASLEELLYAADRAHEEATGRSLPRDPHVPRPELTFSWSESDEDGLARLFPRTWKKFGRGSPAWEKELRRLGYAEEGFLIAASVLGLRFDPIVAADLTGGSFDAEEILASLLAAGWIVRESDTVCTFARPADRARIYAGLKDLSMLHRLAAGALARSGRASEAEIARHRALASPPPA